VVSGYPIPVEFLCRITKPVAMTRFASFQFLEVTEVTRFRVSGVRSRVSGKAKAQEAPAVSFFQNAKVNLARGEQPEALP
ncbi:MAG TPA: hypothetical protein VLL05_16730, partial [Terriglobales bacterium]|nr:hypothetical protein [Terriglobales bacterium]